MLVFFITSLIWSSAPTISKNGNERFSLAFSVDVGWYGAVFVLNQKMRAQIMFANRWASQLTPY